MNELVNYHSWFNQLQGTRTGECTNLYNCVLLSNKVVAQKTKYLEKIKIARDPLSELSVINKHCGKSRHATLRLLKTLVFPIFFYGVETWTIDAEN